MARMPRVPSYCRHKSTNRGYARFGCDRPTYFPGRWNSAESLAAYRRALAEWQARGRTPDARPGETVTVRDLLAAWIFECRRRYRKFGRLTSEFHCQALALRPVRELYADLPAGLFGPIQLETVRARMVANGYVRSSINLHVCRIRAVWKWGAAKGLVPAATYGSLSCVSGLRRGRTDATESEPTGPVGVRGLLTVLRRCSPQVGAMVRLQMLTGMRPGELCAMRADRIDRTGPAWRYSVPEEVAKVGGETYWLGPRAQSLILPWLARAKPGRLWGYTVPSYRRHIRRICDAAGCPPWHPHQLRHSAATRIRRRHGIEVARVALNHTKATTTEIYAEMDRSTARRLALDAG